MSDQIIQLNQELIHTDQLVIIFVHYVFFWSCFLHKRHYYRCQFMCLLNKLNCMSLRHKTII